MYHQFRLRKCQKRYSFEIASTRKRQWHINILGSLNCTDRIIQIAMKRATIKFFFIGTQCENIYSVFFSVRETEKKRKTKKNQKTKQTEEECILWGYRETISGHCGIVSIGANVLSSGSFASIYSLLLHPSSLSVYTPERWTRKHSIRAAFLISEKAQKMARLCDLPFASSLVHHQSLSCPTHVYFLR